MQKLLVIVFMALILSACAVNPIDQADADATVMEAQSAAAKAAQQRAQDDERFRLAQAQREAVSPITVAVQGGLTIVAGIAFSLAMLGWGAGAGIAGVRVGNAVGMLAEVRANLIALNKTTGQFPLLRHINGPNVSLVDPNTGDVMMLNVRKAADRQQIAAANRVRLAGVITNNARQHKDNPEGVTSLGWPAAAQEFIEYRQEVSDDG
jgi:hypothetical protein